MAENKTNAMRMLDRAKVPYTPHTYETDGEHVDGITVATSIGEPLERVYKTLVTAGKSGGHYVFVIPVAAELDLKKAAKAVGEKSVQMIHVKDINKLTGYIRGGCSPIGKSNFRPFSATLRAICRPSLCPADASAFRLSWSPTHCSSSSAVSSGTLR